MPGIFFHAWAIIAFYYDFYSKWRPFQWQPQPRQPVTFHDLFLSASIFYDR